MIFYFLSKQKMNNYFCTNFQVMRSVFAFVFSLSVISLSGQNDTIILPAAEVSSSRIPAEFSSGNRTVTIISKAEIASFPVTTLDELLEFALNTDVRQRGTPGAQSDISVRGGSYEQMAIMLNGVRINDPQTGHHNFNIPLDLGCIQRIEILQGPGTRLYGSLGRHPFCTWASQIKGRQRLRHVHPGSHRSGNFRSRLRGFSMAYHLIDFVV